jgi:membrane fusion protein
MSDSPRAIFRQQVLDTPAQRSYGELVLNRSLNSWVMVWCAVGISLGLMAFLYFGHYTRRVSASGLLMPENGLLRVFAPSGGVVAERLVAEGAIVKKGQLLFVVADERALANAEAAPALALRAAGGRAASATAAVVATAAASNPVNAVAATTAATTAKATSGTAMAAAVPAPNFASAIAQSIAARQRTLEAERQQTEQTMGQVQSALQGKIARLQAERDELTKETALYQLRVDSARQRLVQDKALAQGQFISAAAVQQRQDEVNAAEAALSGAQRGALALQGQQTDARNELAQMPARLSAQMAGFAQRRAVIEQESTESQVRMRVAVVAPADGVVTAILSEAGSSVNAQPLATLLPASSQLLAQLFVPAKSVGFVEPGQQVRIRYQAFPYQKFGQYTGTVSYVSKAQLTQDALPPGTPQVISDGGVYRVTVKLDKQAITAYGKPQALVAGMVLDADIKQDTRRLIEWIFEPIYAIKGKIFN